MIPISIIKMQIIQELKTDKQFKKELKEVLLSE